MSYEYTNPSEEDGRIREINSYPEILDEPVPPMVQPVGRNRNLDFFPEDFLPDVARMKLEAERMRREKRRQSKKMGGGDESC